MADATMLFLESLSVAGFLLFVVVLVRSVALTNGRMMALLAAVSLAALFLIEMMRWRII